ncbi:MAG: phage tail protein [Bacteroidales bacterium]|jgi:phage tail-like protein|nr:phage tail protein [Bacteroidales bacterium]
MGTPTNWYTKFKFVIEIDGIARAAFTKCSELAIEIANVELREGGRLHPHNSPGTVKFPEITMERGVTDDFDLYNWIRDTYDAASGTGMNTPDLYRTFDIVQLDRDGSELERYTVFNAYCRRYAAGDWDNDADENRVESVIIQPEYWERVPA